MSKTPSNANVQTAPATVNPLTALFQARREILPTEDRLIAELEVPLPPAENGLPMMGRMEPSLIAGNGDKVRKQIDCVYHALKLTASKSLSTQVEGGLVTTVRVHFMGRFLMPIADSFRYLVLENNQAKLITDEENQSMPLSDLGSIKARKGFQRSNDNNKPSQAVITFQRDVNGSVIRSKNSNSTTYGIDWNTLGTGIEGDIAFVLRAGNYVDDKGEILLTKVLDAFGNEPEGERLLAVLNALPAEARATLRVIFDSLPKDSTLVAAEKKAEAEGQTGSTANRETDIKALLLAQKETQANLENL